MTTALPAELGDALHTLDALTASLRVAETAEGVHDLAAALAGALEPVRRAHAYLVADRPTLNGEGKVRADHGDTARQAALAVEPRTGTQRETVLRALYRARIDGEGLEGLTDVQLAERTKLPPNTVRPRRRELVEGGFVDDSGERHMHNGRAHAVWQVTAKGLAYYGRSNPSPQ